MKPPPFVGVSLETAQQRYHKGQQKSQQSKMSTLHFLCFILAIITAFDTLFSVMLVYKNSLIVNENILLIQQNQQLIAKVFQLSKNRYWNIPMTYNADPNDTERLSKMIDIRAECPPCTTETPTIIEPYRNPVSILNEATQGRTEYDCEHVCINPPISIATLKIKDPEVANKIWTGKGASKQEAKQVAAYQAITESYNHLQGEIHPDHLPDINYNPKCKQLPPPTGLKKKC